MLLGIYTSLVKVFHFEGDLDLEKFLQIAQDLGLYSQLCVRLHICAGNGNSVAYQLGS